MDLPILIALGALGVIACAEIFCLFFAGSKPPSPPLTAVIPVFPGSEDIEAALSRTRDIILRGSCPIERVILIDYGADPDSLELCREFVRDISEAVILPPEELENFWVNNK